MFRLCRRELLKVSLASGVVAGVGTILPRISNALVDHPIRSARTLDPLTNEDGSEAIQALIVPARGYNTDNDAPLNDMRIGMFGIGATGCNAIAKIKAAPWIEGCSEFVADVDDNSLFGLDEPIDEEIGSGLAQNWFWRHSHRFQGLYMAVVNVSISGDAEIGLVRGLCRKLRGNGIHTITVACLPHSFSSKGNPGDAVSVHHKLRLDSDVLILAYPFDAPLSCLDAPPSNQEIRQLYQANYCLIEPLIKPNPWSIGRILYCQPSNARFVAYFHHGGSTKAVSVEEIQFDLYWQYWHAEYAIHGVEQHLIYITGPAALLSSLYADHLTNFVPTAFKDRPIRLYGRVSDEISVSVIAYTQLGATGKFG